MPPPLDSGHDEAEKSDEDLLVALAKRIDDAFGEHGAEPDRIATLVEEALAHPAADRLLVTGDLLADLAEAYSRAGRTDEAIASHERALAAGYDCVPDPEMDRAGDRAR